MMNKNENPLKGYNAQQWQQFILEILEQKTLRMRQISFVRRWHS